MSVVLGKRLRADSSVQPLRHRSEVTGLPSSEDTLTRLCRLYSSIPKPSLAEILHSSAGDFESAVLQIRNLLVCPEAETLVNCCAVATSLPAAAAILEAGLREYHGARKGKSAPGEGQVETVLRENAALKKIVRFLHEKLQRVAAEAEESERIRAEIQREREVKAALLFHLHRCHA